MVSSAFKTQYSHIPLFHYSKWLSSEYDHQIKYDSNMLYELEMLIKEYDT